VKDRLLLLGVALAAAGAALRLASVWSQPGSFDEVSFLAALTHYDLLAFEPHFPGYPGAVLLARLAAALGAEAPYAAAAAALLMLAAPCLHRAAGGGWGGVLAVGVLAFAPLAVSEGARPMADATATGALALAWALAARPATGPRGAFAVALLLGLSVAAKPDFVFFLPSLSALVVPLRSRRALLASLGLALPLALAAAALVQGAGGAGPLTREGLRFVGGHLHDWGGGVAAAAPGPEPRLALALIPLGAVAGARSPSAIGGGLLLMALLSLRAPRALRRATLVATLGYGLWLLLGQNLHHPRHALPLLPFLAIAAGAGLNRLRAHEVLRAALCAGILAGALSGTIAEWSHTRARGRPADRLAAYLSTQDPLRVRLYAGALGRVVRWRLPDQDVRRVRDLSDVTRDLEADSAPPARTLVTSEVAGVAGLPCVADLGGLRVYLVGDDLP